MKVVPSVMKGLVNESRTSVPSGAAIPGPEWFGLPWYTPVNLVAEDSGVVLGAMLTDPLSIAQEDGSCRPSAARCHRRGLGFRTSATGARNCFLCREVGHRPASRRNRTTGEFSRHPAEKSGQPREAMARVGVAVVILLGQIVGNVSNRDEVAAADALTFVRRSSKAVPRHFNGF